MTTHGPQFANGLAIRLGHLTNHHISPLGWNCHLVLLAGIKMQESISIPAAALSPCRLSAQRRVACRFQLRQAVAIEVKNSGYGQWVCLGPAKNALCDSSSPLRGVERLKEPRGHGTARFLNRWHRWQARRLPTLVSWAVLTMPRSGYVGHVYCFKATPVPRRFSSRNDGEKFVSGLCNVTA